MTLKKTLFTGGLIAGLAATAAFAQDAAAPAADAAAAATEAAPAAAGGGVSPETAYIFNTLLFLIGGFLVMFMAAGFAMLEAGLVRSKNVSMQCLKNIAIYSIAGIMYWIVGYSLMYTDVNGGYIGSFAPYGFDAVGGNALDTGYSTASDWFFQMAFVAATASIVSGTIAVPDLHRRSDGYPLSDQRFVAVGRRLAVRDGLFRLRRFDDRPLGRRLGRTRRCTPRRSA